MADVELMSYSTIRFYIFSEISYLYLILSIHIGSLSFQVKTTLYNYKSINLTTTGMYVKAGLTTGTTFVSNLKVLELKMTSGIR